MDVTDFVFINDVRYFLREGLTWSRKYEIFHGAPMSVRIKPFDRWQEYGVWSEKHYDYDLDSDESFEKKLAFRKNEFDAKPQTKIVKIWEKSSDSRSFWDKHKKVPHSVVRATLFDKYIQAGGIENIYDIKVLYARPLGRGRYMVKFKKQYPQAPTRFDPHT